MNGAALRAAVIGGGIGGLTAALSLLQAGFEVDVYEQAPELTQIGGGINMGPSAARILRGLGLAAGLDREGVRPLFTHQRRWQDGRTLQQAPLNPLCEELYGAPHITIHRADLLAVIAAGFPAERIQTSAIASPVSRATAMASRPGSRTAAGSRLTSWSVPTASIRPCAQRSSVRRHRASRAASRIADWSRASALPLWRSIPVIRPGSA